LIACEDFQTRLAGIAGPSLRNFYTFPTWHAPNFRFFFHNKQRIDTVGISLWVRTEPVEESEHPNAGVQ
jgi:hypothetical protein